MVAYVPAWFKIENAKEYRDTVQKQLNYVTDLRQERINGLDNYPLEFLTEAQSALEVLETALADMERWERFLLAELETKRMVEAAERRAESVPYVLPDDGSRGVRVENVNDLIVADDDITLGDLRHAASSLVLQDGTSATQVFVAMPLMAWHVISSFIRGGE